jgi:hypothetical protein
MYIGQSKINVYWPIKDKNARMAMGIGQYTLIFILWNYSFNWNHDLQERLEGRPYFSICLYDKQNYIYKQSMFLSGH